MSTSHAPAAPDGAPAPSLAHTVARDELPDVDPAEVAPIRARRKVAKFRAFLPLELFALQARTQQAPTLPPKSVADRSRVLRTEEDGVPVTWIDRPRAGQGTIIALHGGAYIHGESPNTWRWLEEVARRSGVAAAMVHYRMPPTHPFPYAVDDALDAIRQILASAAVRDGRWVLAGESAGAGLVLSVLAAMHARHEEMPSGVVLTSPWVDLTLKDPMLAAQAQKDPAQLPELLERAARMYAGQFRRDDPRLSPLLGDLHGLPPVHLVTGDQDLLLGDSRRLRTGLEEAGVELTYLEQPGGVHLYPFDTQGPAAQFAMREQIAFTRRSLGLD